MSETNIPLQQQRMLESSSPKYPSARGVDIYSKITSRIKVSISETFFDSQICALEGLPGGGKTSILQKLKKLDHVLCIDQILPGNPDSDEDLDFDFILNSDKLKSQICYNSVRKTIVLDRSCLSTIAYHWSFDKRYSTQTLPSTLNVYKKCLSIRELFIPEWIIILQTSTELSLIRKNRFVKANQASINPWSDANFLNWMQKFYLNLSDRTFVERLLGEKFTSKILMLDTINNSVEENYSTMLKLLHL